MRNRTIAILHVLYKRYAILRFFWRTLRSFIRTLKTDTTNPQKKTACLPEDIPYLSEPSHNNAAISFVASSLYKGNTSNHNLRGFFNSLIKNTSNINDVEIILGIDKDDDIPYFVSLKREYAEKIPNIRIYIMEEKHGYRGLHLYDKFLYTKISPSSRMVADFSDDCTIVKKNWDRLLMKIDSNSHDNIYFVHTHNFNLEKYIGPLEDNIPKMIWTFKSLAPSSYFPIFSRKVLDICYKCMEDLDYQTKQHWSPVANSYICDCFIDILSHLVQSRTHLKKVYYYDLIKINPQIGNSIQAKDIIKFEEDLYLCSGKTGLNTNDLAFLKLCEKDSINHLKTIANTLADNIKEKPRSLFNRKATKVFQ